LTGFLRRRDRHERAAFQLYGAAVAAARDPYLYETIGVPDTLDGRFDAIGLYVYLTIRHLGAVGEPGPTLAQAVFDAMFSDMDNNLRELGVSDLRVGKRVRAMWEAFHGRSTAYAEALNTADRSTLATALARNVWRSEAPDASPGMLATYVLSQAANIAAQPLTELTAGKVQFLTPRDTVP
jgi:cytochrome b pre-mRNA-processing protein 3